jgi:2-oxoglutarate ferredoxin oxidoreductase subunit beta
MSEEERLNLLPTGILHQNESADEYCELYDRVKAAHQGTGGKITQNDFEKKI